MRYLLGIVLSFFLAGICQAQIVTVTSHSAEIYDEPNAVYVVLKAPRYYPLSVQGEQNGYYRVRDYQGRTGWIEKGQVSTKTEGVVVDVRQLNVRQGPGTGNPVIFRAKKGVAFKVLEKKADWLKVHHESGKKGWVFRSLTWGQ